MLAQITEEGGPLRCLICTIAFGMGVDVPDLSLVMHWGASRSIVNYWQEVGRAGRSGQNQCSSLMFCVRTKMIGVAEEMKDLLQKVFKKEICVREGVLEHLHLEGMSRIQTTTNTSQCSKKCKDCSCSQCMCCCNCRAVCKCRQ